MTTLLEKWERYKSLSLMIIRRSIRDAICGSIPSCETAKEFLDPIVKKYRVQRVTILIIDMIALKKSRIILQELINLLQNLKK